jgi:hypothetical protein
MCKLTVETLTLSELVRDPLIQMVMKSDKVSEEDLSKLLYRIKTLSLGLRNNTGDANGGHQSCFRFPVPNNATEETGADAGDDAGFIAGQIISHDSVGEWLLTLANETRCRQRTRNIETPSRLRGRPCHG